MGKTRYCPANRLGITADSGGSNSARNRLWKAELQRLADETGLTLTIRHLPPGTSKWNRLEHRLFSFITGNWRGQPLLTHQVIIELIAATRTETGLTVRCRLDQAAYPKGVTVSDDELAAVSITRCDFHGEWNYSIAPRATNLVDLPLTQSPLSRAKRPSRITISTSPELGENAAKLRPVDLSPARHFPEHRHSAGGAEAGALCVNALGVGRYPRIAMTRSAPELCNGKGQSCQQARVGVNFHGCTLADRNRRQPMITTVAFRP
jgi:Rhodopirellula transposase DDE domain